jgi:hypothetical protein
MLEQRDRQKKGGKPKAHKVHKEDAAAGGIRVPSWPLCSLCFRNLIFVTGGVD